MITAQFTVDDLAQEIRRVDGNHSLGAGALAEALTPFLAQYVDGQPLKLAIKPLEWIETSPGIFHAFCGLEGLDRYSIVSSSSRATWRFGTDDWQEAPAPTLEAAKAAAQSDYERRMSRALAFAPTLPEPTDERLDLIAAWREAARELREGPRSCNIIQQAIMWEEKANKLEASLTAPEADIPHSAGRHP